MVRIKRNPNLNIATNEYKPKVNIARIKRNPKLFTARIESYLNIARIEHQAHKTNSKLRN